MLRSDRLAALMEAQGLSQADLARAVGIKQPSVFRLVSGETQSPRKLNDIARVLGTSPAYLTGETDDPSAGALPKPTPKLIAEQLDVVQVPQIDLKFGMGGGGIEDAPVKAELMAFSRTWVRHFTQARPDDLFFARGMGDSMYPTINDGDILLIDRSQIAPQMADQIWALAQYGHGMIKRLRPIEHGYRILSDNPNVPPDQATDGSMTIIGRVVAVMRRI